MRYATALATVLAAMTLSAAAQPTRPPEAKRVPRVLEAFGEKRVDDYFWMRERDDPAVIAHLKAENAHTEAMLAPLAPLRETLYREMLGRIRQTDESVPWKKGGWWYYTREVEGKPYPIYCRRRGTMAAPEEVMLDVNALAEGRAYTGVDFWEVSPDGRLLAYGADFDGHRDYEVFVKDLATGELLPDRLSRVDDIAWAADNRTLFYVVQDEAKRPFRLMRHRLGEAKDALVWEEKDERFNLSVEGTRSEAWILAVSASKDTSETRVIPAGSPEEAPRRVAGRRKGHEYYLDHRGDEFWIRTNDKGPNFRLVRAPVADPSPARWKQVIAHRQAIMLEDIDLFERFRVDAERVDGIVRLRITDFATGSQHAIAMPETVHSAWGGANAEFGTDRYRFTYESYVTPRSVYDYVPATRERKLLKRREVLGTTGRRPTRPSCGTPRRRTARRSRSRSSGARTSGARAGARCCSTATGPTGTPSTRTSARPACRCSTGASSSPWPTCAAAASGGARGTTPASSRRRRIPSRISSPSPSGWWTRAGPRPTAS
jgi:oligopeptidase B